MTAEVYGDRKDQRADPEVHRIEDERLAVADVVRDQPDDEPDQCHEPTSVGAVRTSLGGNARMVRIRRHRGNAAPRRR